MWKRKRYTYQLTDSEVIERSKELGITVRDLSGGTGTALSDTLAQAQRVNEIRREIQEAEREIRLVRQSQTALWSAIASVIAALAAWTAILWGK
jgi:septal ring factor EnvC (AmiA/AmiB activator)